MAPVSPAGPVARHADLVYDIGLHKGEDTEFYLAKGFRVVAVEADPALAAHCREKFSAPLREGRLVIVEGAVVDVPHDAPLPATIRFYRNLDLSVWGTTHKDWAARNARLGTRTEEIEVACVDLAAVLREHGMPHYMKIDIEGGDSACLAALAGFTVRPSYLSMESEKVDFERLRAEIASLQALGYDAFVAVQQGAMRHVRVPDEPREGRHVEHVFRHGSSGLFGREVAQEWRTADEVLADYRRIFRRYRAFGDGSVFARGLPRRLMRLLERRLGRRIPGWYDTHARLAGTAGPT